MEANAGEYIKKYLHLKRFPRISLHCKLVPVQHREYEYGLFFLTGWSTIARSDLPCTEQSICFNNARRETVTVLQIIAFSISSSFIIFFALLSSLLIKSSLFTLRKRNSSF